jgi:hypothetical protein
LDIVQTVIGPVVEERVLHIWFRRNVKTSSSMTVPNLNPGVSVTTDSMGAQLEMDKHVQILLLVD